MLKLNMWKLYEGSWWITHESVRNEACSVVSLSRTARKKIMGSRKWRKKTGVYQLSRNLLLIIKTRKLYGIFGHVNVFYRAALNAGRSSREKGVCPSVRLSVKRVNCDKTEEKSVKIFILRKSFSLVFCEKEWLGVTPSVWNFASTGPGRSEIANFEPIFARSASDIS